MKRQLDDFSPTKEPSIFDTSTLSDTSSDEEPIDVVAAFSQNLAAVKRRRVEQRPTQHSSVIDHAARDSGVIKRVELKNFMTHENFALELGPRLNFIIGHNGSGKSSILTAISVCLGARANDTNRANSLTGLIRHGADMSVVTVVLANDVGTRYQPEVYGDEIIIQRTLRTKSTAAPYTLKTESGKTVSSKKGDLDAILDFFNIKVRNPMCFLSQDMARSFLDSTTAETKYKFFMQGTQMKEIIDNLKETSKNLNVITDTVQRQYGDLQQFGEESKEARDLLDKLEASNGLRQRIQLLQGKAYYLEHEQALREKDALEADFEQLKQDISGYDQKFLELDEQAERLKIKKGLAKEQEKEEAEKLRLLKEDIDAKKKEMYKATSEAEEAEGKLQNLQTQVTNFQKEIQKLQRDIEHENRQINRSIGQKEDLEKRLEDLNTEEGEVKEELQHLRNRVYETDERYKSELDSIAADIHAKTDELRELERRINEARHTRQPDPLRSFHSSVRDVLRDVQRTRFEGEVIGPIGRHIFLKEGCEMWGPAIEAKLGSALNMFIVHTKSDRTVIQNILKRNRFFAQVLHRAPETFDYTSGLPNPEHMTILKALEFDNEEVKYALIDMARIEGTVLGEEGTRERYQRVLESERNVGNVIVLKDRQSGFDMSMNGRSYAQNPIWFDTRGPPKLHVKGRENDVSMEVERANGLKGEIDQLKMIRQDKVTELNREKHEHDVQIKQSDSRVKSIRSESYAIQKKLDSVSTGKLDALKEHLTSTQRSKEAYETSVPSLGGDLELLTDHISMLGEQYKEAKNKFTAQKEVMQKLLVKMDDMEMHFQMYIRKKDAYLKTKATKENELKKVEQAIGVWGNKAVTDLQEAEKYCTRESADELMYTDVNAVKAEAKDLDRRLVEAQEILGAEPDEIIHEAEVARQKYQRALNKYKESKESQKMLRNSLAKRVKAYTASRAATCLGSQIDFKYSLRLRSFDGDLQFDFAKERLDMYVKIKNDQEARRVDSLSGGEKSFSQIALLLATWGEMQSRIKGLDEFDVFMDQINRKIGMRLLISRLSKEARSQTIFITPQDIGQIAELDHRYVSIHRIRDPRAAVN